MGIYDWSTSANSNSTVGSINWAEGQPPSSVNDSARRMMADVAEWVNNPCADWFPADSATYASGTTFTVPGDKTFNYPAGRKLRAVVTAGTIYGYVVSSTYSSNTTITAAWDTGSLDSGLSSLKVGLPTNSNLPRNLNLDGPVSISSTSTLLLTLKNTGGNAAYIKYSCSAGGKNVGVDSSSQFFINNSANTVNLFRITDGGATTFTSSVTATNFTVTSDERIKREWQDLPADFLDRLADVLHGTYERIDRPENGRQVGVGARSMFDVLPEAVCLANGLLSVSYGQAALVAAIELAKEVRRLRKLIEAMT